MNKADSLLYSYPSIKSYHQAIASGQITCVGMVQHYLRQISQQADLNAFVALFEDQALQKAAELDARHATGGPKGRLFGVVVGIKDVLCYENHPLTAGSRILEGYHAIYTATAVQRLLDEDAIIIGTLNCDEFAMGSSNEHSVYGRVLNAADKGRVPGGSSGGSAVAVQAGLCMVSLGSDTGGSVRQPADFCGVVGLKPGYGRISRHGLLAYASSFDQVGILAGSVADAALVLEVIAGPDLYDSTVSQQPVPAYTAGLDQPLPARIGYFTQALEHPSLDPEIAAGNREFLENLRKQGHTVEAVPFEYLDYVVPAYYVLTTAEASSNLSRYDGVRFGYRTSETGQDLDGFYKKTRSEGFGKEVKRRIMLGTFVLSAGYFDDYYAKAQQVRHILLRKTEELFQQFDLLVMPTSPTTAFHFGTKSHDAVEMFLADLFTVYANLTGIPAISFPIGKHSNGMPFGIQVMSNRDEELRLLRFSHQSSLRYAMNDNKGMMPPLVA